MSRKENILKAATLLFSEKGYKETSMAEVAQLTRVAQGTIFYHFNTKEALFLSILKAFRDEVTRSFARHTREHPYGSGMEMLEGIVAFYMRLSCEMEAHFMILHRHDAYELARTNTECRAHLEAMYDCFVDIFEAAILKGHADDSIRKGTPRRMALILFTLVDGTVRLNTYRLYDAGALYGDLIAACRRLAQP